MNLELDWKLVLDPYPGAPRGGDAGVFNATDTGATVALIDATGHGLAAYAVAQKARSIIRETQFGNPGDILEELHKKLSGTIGAAISIACINGQKIQFAGVGNVTAYLNDKVLPIRPGVIGQRMREPKIVDLPFPDKTWLFMHTDGISHIHGIPNGSAETVARKIVQDHGTPNDDSAVMLVRWREALE